MLMVLLFIYIYNHDKIEARSLLPPPVQPYNRASYLIRQPICRHAATTLPQLSCPARVAMPSTLRAVVLAIIVVAICSGAGFGISYYTKVGEAAPAMWIGLTVGGGFGLGVVAGYAVAMQHPGRSASGNMAAASPQAEDVAWLPAMQHPSRGQLFQANVRLAAANDVKITVKDDDDDDGLVVDDPNLDIAVNSGDGGLDQLFGAPKQAAPTAVAAAAVGTPKIPTVDMRTAVLRSSFNSDGSTHSLRSPTSSFLIGEEEPMGEGSPRSERKLGLSSPSSTLSRGEPRGEPQQEVAVATAAAATTKSLGAGLQLTATQLRGTQGSPSPRSSLASSPRGQSTPKGWPPGKALPPGLPPGQEARKPSATELYLGVPRSHVSPSCLSPRSQREGETRSSKEGGGSPRPPGNPPPPMPQAEMQARSASFSRGSPSARRAKPDLGPAQQSAPSLSRPFFPPPPPRRPSGQLMSVPPISLVQNAAPTSQQNLSSRSSSSSAATAAPAGPHFAAAAAALRQEAEEAKQQAALRKNERLERAKTENYRRRESGSGRESGPGRLSDGPIRVMTPLTKAPVSPKSSPLVDGPFESSC